MPALRQRLQFGLRQRPRFCANHVVLLFCTRRNLGRVSSRHTNLRASIDGDSVAIYRTHGDSVPDDILTANDPATCSFAIYPSIASPIHSVCIARSMARSA